MKLKAVCTLEEAREVFKQFHDSSIGGHSGFNNTEDLICSRYKWKGITTHLKYFVSLQHMFLEMIFNTMIRQNHTLRGNF